MAHCSAKRDAFTGSQTCGGSSASIGNSKLAGMMPTTVNGSPSSVMLLPMMPGLLPNCRAHKPSLRITVRAAPGLSSSAANTRPRSGGTPSIGKRSDVTMAHVSDAASPAPVSVTAALVYTARRSSVVIWACQSRKSG